MRLFHCIVVMGAAVGAGCGGKAGQGASGSPDGSAGDPPSDAASGQGWGAESNDGGCFPDLTQTNGFTFAPAPGCAYTDPCAGTPRDPLGPSQCAHPQQLSCANDPPYTPTSNLHGCACDTTAPLVPTDCPQTMQFNCVDWATPCGCWCNSTAPASPSDCTQAPPDAAVPWACHSYDPPVGCACLTVPPPIL